MSAICAMFILTFSDILDPLSFCQKQMQLPKVNNNNSIIHQKLTTAAATAASPTKSLSRQA